MAVYSHDISTKYYSRDDLLFLITSILIGVLTIAIFLSILVAPQPTNNHGVNQVPPSKNVQEGRYPLLGRSGSPMGDYVSPHTPLYWRG
jgi:hypothetical protein